MNVQEVIYARRSVKHYDANFQMPQKDITRLLELTLQSPTSFNIQNWRFVLVEDKNIRQQIREAAWDQVQITDASLLFALCADLKSWNKQPERYWKNAPADTQDLILTMIRPFYDGNEQLQRDEALRSIGIAAQTMMLAAKDMGYDSCPMIGFHSDKVAEIINLPADHVLGMLLSVGKGTKEAWDKPGQLPLSEVLLKNHF